MSALRTAVRRDTKRQDVEAERRSRFRLSPRGARRARVAALAVLVLVLAFPVFRYNALGASDGTTFNNWQIDSQALVLAKIESTTTNAIAPGIDALGLLTADPNQLAPSDTFDKLASGFVPTTTRYLPYQSQIGLPGYLFTALYHLGFTSLSALQGVCSALTVAALALFTFLLARRTRISFAALFAIAALGSPWLTIAGRNLYWVPWTWFLPACAALWYCGSKGRTRWFALLALAAAFMIKWASGYEFLTSVTLLAAAMPVLCLLLGPERKPTRVVMREVAVIVGVAVLCFVVSVVALAFLVGAGNPAYGANIILYDVGKRTYGGVATDNPLLAASFAANPFDVLATYLFSWNTNLLAFGAGWSPLNLIIGPSGLWTLVIASAAVVVVRVVRRDTRWIRDAWIVGISLAIPISWFVAAKAHSYVHPFIDFVIWYLLTVGALLWVVGAALVPMAREALMRGIRFAAAAARTVP